VTEIITGSVQTARLAVTDTNLNTYIGRDAGASATDTASNVGLGYSAMAGAVNSSNNVAVGMFSLDGMSNSDSNVALGARTDITGRGQRNVLIGPNVTMGDGSGNILIGADISAGNVSKRFQLGTLLYGDLSSGYVGINTSTPAAALDISGIVVFRNKVGFQNPNPVYSLDVAGSLYASEQIIGGKGTQSNPMYTFFDSPGSGMYIPVDPSYGTGSFAIAVNQKPAAIFSSNAVNFFQNLDVSGTFSARNIDISAFSVTNGTPGIPSVTFTNDTSTGLYLAASNRLGVTTGGFRRMEVLSNGDVSMGRLVTKDISYSGTIVGTDPNTCNVIGGVTLCNGNVILTGTATNSNLLVPGWIRNTTTAFVLDISSGNISNSLTTRSSNFRASAGTAGAPAYSFASDATTGVHSAGTSQLAFDTAGVQRMVISNGNVGIGKATPVVALEVVGDVSATTYNGPGGTQSAPHYTFSDDRTTGLFFPGANMIGLSAGGTERVRISNSNIGIGTTAPTNALDVSGTLRVIGTAGDLTFTNGTISLAGVPVISSTGVLSNATSTSNSIGGVTLSNTNIAYAGAITGGTDGASNKIGGVTLSNTNITYAGAISNTVNTTSNRIGGVTLSNTNITYAGAITGGTDGTSNKIGGVTLSNTSINYAGAITGATDSAVNRIGGVTLCNGQVVNTSYTSSSNFVASNGTAGFPAYAFASEAGLGVFRPGANQLALATSGSNRMTFDATGGIGIGQPSPAGALDVLSPSDGTGKAVIQVKNSGTGQGIVRVVGSNQANTTGLELFHTGSYGGLYLPAGISNLSFWTAGARQMDLVNGRIGVGNATPSATLDLAAAGAWIAVNRNGNIPFVSDVSMIVEGGNGVGLYFQKGDNNNFCGISIKTLCNNTLAERFRVDANTGRIGIGTTTPGNLLSVVAPSSIGWVNRASRTPSNYQVSIADCNGIPGLYLGAYYTGGQGAASTLQSSDSWNGTINPAPLLLNPVGGTVGIGTPAPVAVLDISAGGDAFRIGNGNTSGGPFFQVKNELSAYANVTMNGYFTLLQANTTNGKPYISFSPEYRIAGHWLIGNDVGIGTTTPSQQLDVSGVFRVFDNGQDVMGLMDPRAGNYLRIGAWNRAGGTSKNIALNPNGGNVGIGKTDPGYRLDVTSEATTAAAINASTWSRSAVSTSYYGVFNGQPDSPNPVVAWTTCNAINSDIMEVADNKGTYFRPKVSGIYSFNVWMGGQDFGNPIITIDVSTNAAHAAKNVGNTPEIAVNTIPSGNGRASVSWTGYLPGAAHYYKIKMTSLGNIATNAGGGKIYVTFLGEVGVGSAQPW
jgi:hypothetical protein